MAASPLINTSSKMIAPVIEHIELTPHVRRLVLDAPELARSSHPGQFVHVLCSDSNDPLLRRPFSIHDADSASGHVSLLYEIRGRGTELLAEKRPGDKLDLLGPLGEGFELPKSAYTPQLLIAGGIAVAPLYFLARRITESIGPERVTVVIGAKSECMLTCLKEYSRLTPDVRIATDDGTAGYHGFVTGPLQECIESMDKANPPLVYACGPMPMLKAVSKITGAHGLKCQISTEAKMACGVGACMSCVIKVRSGDSFEYVRCCKEGPVFDADEVIWE